MKKIRNFCIIAHIDHGKSTLSDRLLEITNTIDKRKMKDQVLDTMDLERERGITIKLQPVTMNWQGYVLNLIDTPGHVDFSYEVSRSLAAVEGAVLLIDATQGIQAQTLANLYLAMAQDLVIVPIINKIDLPAADIKRAENEIVKLLGCAPEDIILTSAKTGEGVEEVLKAVIERVPGPKINEDKMTRALIFDSNYDEFKGVVAHVRVVDGSFKKGDKIKLVASLAQSEILDIGVFTPDYKPTGELETGEVGYIVTGFKDVVECRVGDTITLAGKTEEVEPLKGYEEVKPMVFAGIFPREGDDFKNLREAMERLKLNDASLTFEPETSEALGFGFRCGFLGLLHLEIFQERLKREFGLDLIVTIPSVSYIVHKRDGSDFTIRTPQKLPRAEEIEKVLEPWVSLDVVTPKEYIGNVMELVQKKRGVYKNIEHLDESLVILHYEIPMVGILTDFYDKIKGVSSGFASINYDFLNYQKADVVKMDILVAEEPIEALSLIVYKDEAFRRGKEIVKTLKETLPKQMFVLKLQAAVGGKIIASERLSAMRKDVTAKLYGGDVTRKRKLLEKQKKGKKKMMAAGKGSVEIPPETFVKILKK